MTVQRNKTEDDITAEVLERFAATPDPRLQEIMLGLIKHLHAFVKEVQLTEAEWFQAIEILTEALPTFRGRSMYKELEEGERLLYAMQRMLIRTP